MSTTEFTKNIQVVDIDFHKEVHDAKTPQMCNLNTGDTVPAIAFLTASYQSSACISYREPATLHVTIDDCVHLDVRVPSVEEGLAQLGVPDRADHIKYYKSQGMTTDCAVKQADKDMKAWKQFKQDCMNYLEKLVYSNSQSV